MCGTEFAMEWRQQYLIWYDPLCVDNNCLLPFSIFEIFPENLGRNDNLFLTRYCINIAVCINLNHSYWPTLGCQYGNHTEMSANCYIDYNI